MNQEAIDSLRAALAERDALAAENKALREAAQQALDAFSTCSQGDYSTGHVIDPSFDVDAVNAATDALAAALTKEATNVTE